MTCNSVQLSSRFICLSRFLKPNDKKLYQKHLITIDHKHNLYINFRLARITYFYNATVINTWNLPSWFNRSYFQPLFTSLSDSFIKSRLYNLKNNTIIPISSNYNAFWQICLVIIFGTLYFYRLRYFYLGRASRIVHQSSV